MATHTLTLHGHKYSLLWLVFCIHLHVTYGSPVHENGESKEGACPAGWYHYERFCVAQGRGSSDRQVAVYCDGFGGIGIKGLCIIKAHVPEEEMPSQQDVFDPSAALRLSLGLGVNSNDSPENTNSNNVNDKSKNNHYSSNNNSGYKMFGANPKFSGSSDQSLVQGKTDIERRRTSDPQTGLGDTTRGLGHTGMTEVEEEEEELCPAGWTHYRSICVLKPWSVRDRCHHLGAVEFNGLCLKHANTNAVRRRASAELYSQDKRICCCAHVKARANRYGC